MADRAPSFSFEPAQMSDREFALYQTLVDKLTGIHLAPIKKAMLAGRLARRLRDCGVDNFTAYFALIDEGGDRQERQIAIDLITTNESYFFREPKHFEAIATHLLPLFVDKPLRAWSAACANGEEPYTLAMVLAQTLGEKAPWEVVASDISSRVLATMRRGLYPMERAKAIPPEYLKAYCLKGTAAYAGHFLVERRLRERVTLAQINLVAPLPEIGFFDLIMLRNVIIYFDAETKRRVVRSILSRLKPGGWLVVGHAESLIGLPDGLEQIMPTIYRKASP
ncbi:MAG: protein-glutamate O-methyltransferase CheR [Burkholderiales bacterium]|nr:protein-glutamate O-methyltransferase CheR [Burkholderiales bacterium]